MLLINVLYVWCLALRVTQIYPTLCEWKKIMTSASQVPACALSHPSLLRPSLFYRWGSWKRYSETLVQGCLLCNIKLLPSCYLSSFKIYLLALSRNHPSIQRGWRWHEMEWTYCWAHRETFILERRSQESGVIYFLPYMYWNLSWNAPCRQLSPNFHFTGEATEAQRG